MIFKSIKTRIYSCFAVWLVVMLMVHVLMSAIGMKTYGWSYLLLETTVTAILLVPFAGYLNIHIVRPLEELSGVMTNVIHGIQPEPINNAGNDEIGLMIGEFNTIIHALHQRDILLKGMNERLQARNKELISINERLAEADRVKTHFLAGVTHEFKTPLSTIRGYSEMMLEGVGGQLNTQQKDFVDEITASTVHLDQMVNDVLDFSKAAAGSMEIRFEEFDLAVFLKDIEMDIRPMLLKKSHSLEKLIHPSVTKVVADRLRIKQVMLNLLSNAIKFTPEAGWFTIRSFKGEGHWGLVVEDNGIGIKAEDFARVFEPFSQVDSSYTRKFEGTGLGLAICQRIVGMHGGRMWVESLFGKGSSFYFTIPDNLRAGLTAGQSDNADKFIDAGSSV